MTKFKVFLGGGMTCNIVANTPLEAAILAQADAIRMECNFTIDKIVNTDNNTVWEVDQNICRRRAERNNE